MAIVGSREWDVNQIMNKWDTSIKDYQKSRITKRGLDRPIGGE